MTMNSEPKRKGHTPILTDLSAMKPMRAHTLQRSDGLMALSVRSGLRRLRGHPFEVKASVRKNGRHVPARSLYKCKACGRQFSVTKGTIFEDSKIPLRTWLIVAQRMVRLQEVRQRPPD